MNWLNSIEAKDWLVVIATLLSPLIAVQVSKWIERSHQSRDEQVRIFKTLMATRAANLDPRHVESLNVIDVVFHSKSRKETEIRRLWKQYLDHLNDRAYPRDGWGAKRVELLVELLHAMATFLGFDFDKTHIKNQAYYPEGYGDIEDDHATNRKALREILTGMRPLPIWVGNFPVQPESANDQSGDLGA
jgi:hypothetical protein